MSHTVFNNRFTPIRGTMRSKKAEIDKRTSLIAGKLIHSTFNKRSKRYRRFQMIVYNYLERPVGAYAISYQLIIFATVFLCLILSVLATIPQYENTASNILMYTEMVIVFWLSIELGLRIWSAGCRSRYQTWKGRLKFMKNVFCILDLTVIIASISLTIIATSQNRHKNFAAAAFRGLRFFQILRMLRVDRRAGTWRLLGTVVWAHRQELITTFYIGFLSLIVSSFIMYLLEKDAKETKIHTFADSLWWGVITLCTIGYGDVYPVTWGGKLLASSCALIGISFFALPAGILGSGFALKVQAMQRQKHLNRRRAPAATLIQSIWRCYASDPNSLSTATWKTHLKAIAASHNQQQTALSALHHHHHQQQQQQQQQQHMVIPEYSIANLAKPYIGPNSFLNRVASLKRRMPPGGSTAVDTSSSLKTPHSNGGGGGAITTNSTYQHKAGSSGYVKTNSLNTGVPRIQTSNNEFLASRRDAIVIPGLFSAHTSVYNGANQVATTATRSSPNSTSNRAAQQSRPPTPEPTEPLLSRSSCGDTATATNANEMDTATAPPSFQGPLNEFDWNNHSVRSNTSFIVALQQFPARAAAQQQQHESGKITPVKSSFAHRTLNFLSELNTGGLLRSDHDDDGCGGHHHHHSVGKPQLTAQQKNAIRALRKIKYFVARRKFREALRPYDVTDVIEQYSAGNLDMLARIKTLQFRLDKILGSTKAKDCYDTSTISLASRIVKVERQIDDIEIKFDKFFTNYTIDMKIIIEKLSSPNERYLLHCQQIEGQQKQLESACLQQKPNQMHPNTQSNIDAASKSNNSKSKQPVCRTSFRQKLNHLASLDNDDYEDYYNDDDFECNNNEELTQDDCEDDLNYDENQAPCTSKVGSLLLNNDNTGIKSVKIGRLQREIKSKQQQHQTALFTPSKSDFAIKNAVKRKKDKKLAFKKYLLNAIFQQQKFKQCDDADAPMIFGSMSNLRKLQKYKSDSQLLQNVEEMAGESMSHHKGEKAGNSTRNLGGDKSARNLFNVTTKSQIISKNFNHNFKFTIDFKNIKKKLVEGRKAIKKRSFYSSSSSTANQSSTAAATDNQIPLIKIERKGSLSLTTQPKLVAKSSSIDTEPSFCTIDVTDETKRAKKKTSILIDESFFNVDNSFKNKNNDKSEL